MTDNLDIPDFLKRQYDPNAPRPKYRPRSQRIAWAKPVPSARRRVRLERLLGRLPHNMDDAAWAFAEQSAKDVQAKRDARMAALRALRRRP